MSKLTDYIKASIEEMKKVTWPTKKETYNYTGLVIGISLALAAFLGLCDSILAASIEYLLQRG